MDVHRAWWQAMSTLIEFQTKGCLCGLPPNDTETCDRCEPLTRPMRELERAGAMP